MHLNPNSLPLRDYHKAKRLAWNPQDLDFTQDRKDWDAMSEREQALIRAALGQFLGGEQAVTHDLTPLLLALKREGGHLEEEMFLTTQLFEEAKHVEFFAGVLAALGLSELDIVALSTPNYTALFTELTRALDALLVTPSAQAQIEAVANYHIVVEGVLAETGYYGFFTALRARGLMPGLTRGLELLQRDESRHIAFGLHLIARLLAADPSLRLALDAKLNALLPLAQGVFMEALGEYLPEIPFGLDLGDLLSYASKQYMARLNVLDRARQGQPIPDTVQ